MSARRSSPIDHGVSSVENCFSRLVYVLDRRADRSHNRNDMVSLNGVQDELSRFSVWLGEVHALSDRQETTSLDVQLDEAPQIASMILECLEDLAQSLDDRK